MLNFLLETLGFLLRAITQVFLQVPFSFVLIMGRLYPGKGEVGEGGGGGGWGALRCAA